MKFPSGCGSSAKRSEPRLRGRCQGRSTAGAIPLIPLFDLVVFLYAPTAQRLRRLRERGRRRYGAAALAPGGLLHEQHEAFLACAAAYDDGSREGRSRPRHEAWLARLHCPVLRIDGAMPADAQIEHILDDGGGAPN